MEFKYSTVVDPATYETYGLCDGVPLLYHKHPEQEEIGALRCHEHWRKWVGPLGLFKGVLGARWGVVSACVPECLPERLWLIAYANELGFLHDDVTDIARYGDTHNDDLKAAFDEAISTGVIEHSASGKRAMQAYLAREMIKVDKEQALTVLKSWVEFLKYAGRQQEVRFRTVEEYFKYRMEDIGTMFFFGTLCFGMGLTIPKDEVNICHELASTAYLHMALVNDLFSWQKERESAAALGKDYCPNTICVLMEEHKISEDEAKERCRQKIREETVAYQKIVEETKARDDLCLDSKKYIEAMLYTFSGNVVWSMNCPRYNSGAPLNKRHLALIKNGTLDGPGIQSKADRPTICKETMRAGAADGPATGLSETDQESSTRDLVNPFVIEHVNGSCEFKLGDHDFKPNWNGRVLQGEEKLAIQAPYDYITALPSKGLREQTIDALDVWFQVPPAKLERIKLVITILHNASLMLDDLEDGSELRRGKPSTHTIFGASQTINAANYQIIRALEEVQKLGDAKSVCIFTEEMQNLFIGQSMDLYWTNNLICPSINDYFRMIGNKTGGLFRLFGRLMALHSTNPIKMDPSSLLDRLGRYFQTRDDYQNLVSAEYTSQKGFCEDLAEGKFSLPIIHLMQSEPGNYIMRNLWTQRRVNRTASQAHKQTVLDLMKKSGSLKFTLDTLTVLYGEVEKGITELEGRFGVENFELRLVLELLQQF